MNTKEAIENAWKDANSAIDLVTSYLMGKISEIDMGDLVEMSVLTSHWCQESRADRMEGFAKVFVILETRLNKMLLTHDFHLQCYAMTIMKVLSEGKRTENLIKFASRYKDVEGSNAHIWENLAVSVRERNELIKAADADVAKFEELMLFVDDETYVGRMSYDNLIQTYEVCKKWTDRARKYVGILSENHLKSAELCKLRLLKLLTLAEEQISFCWDILKNDVYAPEHQRLKRLAVDIREFNPDREFWKTI